MKQTKKKLQTAILLLLSLMFLTILYPQPIFPVLFAVIWIIYRVRCYLKGKQSFHADIFHILLFVMLFFSLVFGLGITAEIIKERQQSDVTFFNQSNFTDSGILVRETDIF